MSRAKKHGFECDEDWLAAVADDLRDQGCDEEFIECTLDELREGHDVTVVSTGLSDTQSEGRKP